MRNFRRASVQSFNTFADAISPSRKARRQSKCAGFGFDTDANIIAEIRSDVHLAAEKNPEKFHEKDLRRIDSDDWTITRYIMDCDNDVKKSSRALIDTLLWRKEAGVNDLSRSDFPREFYQCGILTVGRDQKGGTVAYIRTTFYKKLPGWTDVIIQFILATMEYHGQPLGPFEQMGFCCDYRDTGMSAFDLTLITKLLPIMTRHYPSLLSYAYVYELPWVLKACCSMIINLLPEKERKLIKFIDRRNIHDHLDDEHIPDFLGGQFKSSYAFPNDTPSIEEVGLRNGISEENIQKCRAHFESMVKKAQKLK